jgi:hypothetical protein
MRALAKVVREELINIRSDTLKSLSTVKNFKETHLNSKLALALAFSEETVSL